MTSLQRIGVVGAGLMGHGIAQVAAWPGGFDVVLHDAAPGALDAGVARIAKSLGKLVQKAVERGALEASAADATLESARARITATARFEDLAPCDLVVEAIVEDLATKRALFERLDAVCKPDAILATNTSSLPVQAMAEVTRRPSRVVGLHFFNPVQLMKLVEVVRTPATDDAVFAAARRFAEQCGKTAVACGDTPGFVVNRLLVPYLVQAMLMVDRGDATPEDIDTAMQLGAGHPMGPLTLADYVGLDTTLAILEGWRERHPDEPAFVVPECLRAQVAAGRLGRKTGQGFWRWDGDRRV